MIELPIMIIVIPFVMGAALLLVPRKLAYVHGFVSVSTAIAVSVLAYLLFIRIPISWSFGGARILNIDALAGFVALFISFFGVVITLYSVGFMKEKMASDQYSTYLLWTVSASLGAVFSNNLVSLLTFWGFLGLTLYMLILAGGPKSAAAAKKTLIIIGGSDAAMLLGIAVIWKLTGTLGMDAIRLDLNGGSFVSIAFLCLAMGAFAKAGAMPMHTWIPDSSEVAPVPVTAFLPASLDKLLGIYLLARLVLNMFIITPGSGMSTLLLFIGALTIIAAVMMALVQHNMKKLLAYHAVSQVGYMVLGIGTANPIGIAGGLFHMVNNAIYKSCLFLSGGSVEKKTGTSELDELGGLARFMPITFATCLIASLSISGVPPFNGFFSKWMIYQSILESGKTAGCKLWVVWLAVAMFGSALTLASFMKLIYSTFLSPRPAGDDRKAAVTEAPFSMWLPQAALALLCVAFGVFAYRIPLKVLIVPSLGGNEPLNYTGIWNAPLATVLVAIGLILGFSMFILGRIGSIRKSDIFIGGEELEDNSGIKGTAFYNTVKEMPMIGALYKLADKKVFDVYEEGTKGTFFFTNILRWLHNGVLPTYMVWCLIGMLAIFFALMR